MKKMGRNISFLFPFFGTLALSSCYASTSRTGDAVPEEYDPPAPDPIHDPAHDPVPDPDVAPDPQEGCPDGCGSLQCCGDRCVNLQADMSNCGYCGNVCDPVRSNGCTYGNCTCQGALACRVDQACCGGVGCRNIQTDPSNCGGCGAACDIGETCVEGSCRCGGGPPCGPEISCCSGYCTDTMADPLNCGACDIPCGDSGPECVDGQCTCGGQPACPWSGGYAACMGGDYSMFQKCCGGACVIMDEAHCGSCGQACGEGQTCQCTFSVFSCG
jgi:hypothetical protein